MIEGEEDDGPPPGWQQPIPPRARSRSPPPAPSPSVAEMAQMVCGSCSHLLSYPQGARHVKCSCCQMVNYVLEGSQQAPSMVCTAGATSSYSQPCSLTACICWRVRLYLSGKLHCEKSSISNFLLARFEMNFLWMY
ncbi:protein LOL2 isoform X1 [Tripterygium wilfordii]|uniref:protein LOL2 isoform X1 n=1 Tax=Tripterygium wilfordii TaxID=458696 RepID=UPI0018F80EE5|nr:protein LOL2 isoform X1 [Tripterygium wilfordii]